VIFNNICSGTCTVFQSLQTNLLSIYPHQRSNAEIILTSKELQVIMKILYKKIIIKNYKSKFS